MPYKTKPRGVSGYGIRDLFRAVGPGKIHKKLWKNRPSAQLSMRLGLEVQGTELDGKRMMQCNGARVAAFHYPPSPTLTLAKGP